MGAMPFHVMAQPADIDFSERFYIGSSASQDTDEGPPLMIRHGARTVDFDTGIAFNDWRLFIDVSSLLLATQLEILEVLDSAVATVIVLCIQGQLMAFADSLEHPHPKTAEIESTIADALKRVPSAFGRNPRGAGSDVLPFGNSSEIWTVVNDSESVPDGDRHITLAAVIEDLGDLARLTQWHSNRWFLTPGRSRRTGLFRHWALDCTLVQVRLAHLHSSARYKRS